MHRAIQYNPSQRANTVSAVSVAAILHIALFGTMIFVSAPMVQAHLPASLSIVVIENSTKIDDVQTDVPKKQLLEPPEAQPRQKPIQELPPKEIQISPPAEETDQPQSEQDTGLEDVQTEISVLQNEAQTSDPGEGAPAKVHIPSRWALKPPLATQRLEGLGFTQADIECLTSLEVECQDLRKKVFVEYLLTETELVWTPDRPDSGMPAEFRGLSKPEILEKLGMNYAGGNAFVILPGIAIDGPLWDRLHGVNKPCRLQRAISGPGSQAQGGIGVRRVCD